MSELNDVGYVKRNAHSFPLRSYLEVQIFLRNNPAISNEFNGFAFKVDEAPMQPWLMTKLKKGSNNNIITFEAIDGRTTSRLKAKNVPISYSVKGDLGDVSVDDVTVVFKTLSKGKLNVFYIIYNDVLLFTVEEIHAILSPTAFDVVPITAYNNVPASAAYLAIPYSDRAIEFPYSSLQLMGVLGSYTNVALKGNAA